MIEQLADDLIGFLLPLEQSLHEWAEKQTDAVSAELMRHYAFSANKLAENVAKTASDMGDDRESSDCMYAEKEFDVKEAQEMIDLWLKDDAPEWVRTKMMGILYEQWQNKNIRRFVQPDLCD